MKLKNEYYMVSNEHTYNHIVRSFWKPNGNGYTFNIEEAGFYPKNYPGYTVITKDNFNMHDSYEDFLIHKDDLHLLGREIKCIMN